MGTTGVIPAMAVSVGLAFAERDIRCGDCRVSCRATVLRACSRPSQLRWPQTLMPPVLDTRRSYSQPADWPAALEMVLKAGPKALLDLVHAAEDSDQRPLHRSVCDSGHCYHTIVRQLGWSHQ